MMRVVLFICLALLLSLKSLIANNPELVIGEERVEPGIVFIFEGAIKDHVMPMSMHLSENETHVHICLLYTSPSPRDKRQSRMPSSA